jgi:hypothetical protein
MANGRLGALNLLGLSVSRAQRSQKRVHARLCSSGDALKTRDRYARCVLKDSGSAMHRSALHRILEKRS